MNDAAVDAALAMFERMLHPSMVPDRHAVREALREAHAHPEQYADLDRWRDAFIAVQAERDAALAAAAIMVGTLLDALPDDRREWLEGLVERQGQAFPGAEPIQRASRAILDRPLAQDARGLSRGQWRAATRGVMTTVNFKPSDPVNPYVDSYCWNPDGWEMASEYSVQPADDTTRGQAAAYFSKFGPGYLPDVRVWKRYVEPLTRQVVWDDYGRERWEDNYELDDDEGPTEPPADWQPDEYDPVWRFVHRSHPGAIAVWICGLKEDEPPENPAKP